MPRTRLSGLYEQKNTGRPPEYDNGPEETPKTSAPKNSIAAYAALVRNAADEYVKTVQGEYQPKFNKYGVALPGRQSDALYQGKATNNGNISKDDEYTFVVDVGGGDAGVPSGKLTFTVVDGRVELKSSTYQKDLADSLTKLEEKENSKANSTTTAQINSLETKVDSEGYLIIIDPITKKASRVMQDGKPVKAQPTQATPQTPEQAAYTAAQTRAINTDLDNGRTANQNTYISTMGKDELGAPTLDREKWTGERADKEWEQKVKFPYEALQKEFEAKRDFYSTQVSLGRMKLDTAKEQLAAWKTQYYDIPHQQYQDQMTRAQEQRLRQQVADEAAKTAADVALRRATLQQSARQLASEDTRSLLPYSVGNSFASEFAAGLGALGRSDPSGVNFSADAFSFKAPDFAGIEEAAAKNAVRGVPQYDRKILDKNWTSSLPDAPNYLNPDVLAKMPSIPDFNITGTGADLDASMTKFSDYVRNIPGVEKIVSTPA